MQNYAVKIKTLKNEQITIMIPIVYTIYQVKKEAFRYANLNHIIIGNNLEVFINKQKITDLTCQISQVIKDKNSLIQLIQKQQEKTYQSNYQTKFQLTIGWNNIQYNISVLRNATIQDMKNKTMQMLGLQGQFYIKNAQIQIPSDQSAFKYILCNNLKLERGQTKLTSATQSKLQLDNQIQVLQKEARLVESVCSSQKQNNQKQTQIPYKNPHTSGSQMLTAHPMKRSNFQNIKKQFARHNSMKQVVVDQDGAALKSNISNSNSNNPLNKFRKLAASINSSQNENEIILKSNKTQCLKQIQENCERLNAAQLHFSGKHKTLESLARHLQSQAKETLSINSSTQSDLLQFQQLYIHFINEDNSRHYTLQCNRQMQLLKAVQKIAKLQKVNVDNILLFNFDLKLSINSNIKQCDVNKFIPDTMKVYQIADSKQKQHTILFRNRTLINKSLINKIDKVIESVEQGVTQNKQNFNGINKLMESKKLSRSVQMEEVCPNSKQIGLKNE